MSPSCGRSTPGPARRPEPPPLRGGGGRGDRRGYFPKTPRRRFGGGERGGERPAPVCGAGRASAYAASKLANVLFTKELQRRLEGTTVTANCFEPGIVRSQFGAFGSDLGILMRVVFTLSLPFSKSPEEGADSLIWLATSPEAASLKGQYVSNRRPVSPSKRAMDPKLAADLWTLSEKLCAEVAARAA